MLTESKVIRQVCRYLKTNGWKIVQVCSETEKGDDIVAQNGLSKEFLIIEAKGETSSKSGSARYGNPFNSGQIKKHVANAYFRASQATESKRRRAIALPKTAHHELNVKKILWALRKLKIEVFWVSSNGKVELEGSSQRAISV